MPFLRLKYWIISIIWILVLSFVFAPITAFGSITVFESFVGINHSKIEFIGDSPGEQFGSVMAVGDFNGDGLQDIVVGSPFSSIEQREWNGKASIVFGEGDFQNKKIDLYIHPPDVTFFGANSGDQLGSSLTVGDYNKDGISDVLIGAYNAYQKPSRTGRVYLIYGHKVWDKQSYDFLVGRPDLEFTGGQQDEGFGLTLSTVDINNDDIDDILIGSPLSSSDGVNKTGMVYAFFGRKKVLSTSVYASSDANIVFYGQQPNERFGSSISGGHIFDRNFNDIVIGAYAAKNGELNQAGKVYIYKGKDRIISPAKTPTAAISGTHEKEWFGFATAVGDISGDGKADIAISSFPYLGNHDLAKVFVFFARRVLGESHAEFSADDKTANLIIGDPHDEALIGSSVLLDDFNNDKKDEIVVGAPGVGDPISSNAGDVYMIFDAAGSEITNYSAENESVTSTIHGENEDDWFGYSLAGSDFNNDGYKDLIVGSRYSDWKGSANNGKVFVLFGNGKPYGNDKTVVSPSDRYVNRAVLIHEVVDKLQLKDKKADFIANCYEHKNFCLFNFVAMSMYNDIKLDPSLVLYPDIPPNHEYYEDIVVGTMLGLVNGTLTEKNSPFYPDKPITRIQALKVILGAADLVKPMYRFELVRELGSAERLANQASSFGDVDPRISYMWWYPRYTNFALEHGIIKQNRIFRPDDKITVSEFDSMLTKTLEYLKSQSQDEKT